MHICHIAYAYYTHSSIRADHPAELPLLHLKDPLIPLMENRSDWTTAEDQAKKHTHTHKPVRDTSQSTGSCSGL